MNVSARLLAPLLCVLLSACGAGSGVEADQSADRQSDAMRPTQPAFIDRSCDEAVYPQAAWLECDLMTFALTRAGMTEPLENPAFMQQILRQSGAQVLNTLTSIADDPSRLFGLPSLSYLGVGPLIGDPFRYPGAPGPNGSHFYETEAEVVDVLFHDRLCARLPGKVFRPRAVEPGTRLPAIVINNGSIVGIQGLYLWAVQPLVRAGYLVMTFDHRGQGQSDFLSPDGTPGTNLEPSVFWLNLVDAIDFLHSSPEAPHPQNLNCAATGSSEITAYNPQHQWLDRTRLGVAGHSFGAAGASIAQSCGAPSAEPWPGWLVEHNPIDVIVAWDALGRPGTEVAANGFPLIGENGSAGAPLYLIRGTGYPAIIPRVPALDMPSDYGLLSSPYLLGIDRDAFMPSFRYWQEGGEPVMVVIPQASTHGQYSPPPLTPAASWCPADASPECDGGWALPMQQHYTVAWFDRWLKLPGEPGHEDADARLLDDGHPVTGAVNMSWHFPSARDFPNRRGGRQHCEDIRAGCDR
jgi:hypothetical protein